MVSVRRSVSLVLCSTLLLGACGGGEVSLTEYVDQINAIAIEAGEKGAALIAAGESVEDFTPEHLRAGLERGLTEIRVPLQAAADVMEPPDQIADLHDRMWDWHGRFIVVEEALAERAGVAEDSDAGWRALSDSPEMAAYRTAIGQGKRLCTDLQAELDATSERGVYADNPWLPPRMKEVVNAVLGCEWFPEDPENVYRYPPPASMTRSTEGT
jgi:hypothetical protein